MIFLDIFKNFFNFEQAVRDNDLIGVLLIIIFVLIFVVILLYKSNKKTQKQYDQSLEDLIKKEEIRREKEKESEKELLEVLNGLSTILKMGEQSDKYQTEKILDAIKNLEVRLLDKIDMIQK